MNAGNNYQLKFNENARGWAIRSLAGSINGC